MLRGPDNRDDALGTPFEQWLLRQHDPERSSKGNNEWFTRFDLAAAARGELPADLLSDKELVASLPLIFQTIRGKRVPREQLDELIKIIRES